MHDSKTTKPANEPGCLVLMFKSPARSKSRIAEAIGPIATEAAARLLDCAIEDMRDWPGPVCFAPASSEDADWLAARMSGQHTIVLQREGNLGARLNHVCHTLRDAGFDRQIFIGIDCPELNTAYLLGADRALDADDVVLAPADDGGVVLMGTRDGWPPLTSLPWSREQLGEALAAACRDSGRSVAWIDGLADIDSLEDLDAARVRLASDRRAARRALVDWLDEHAGTVGAGTG